MNNLGIIDDFEPEESHQRIVMKRLLTPDQVRGKIFSHMNEAAKVSNGQAAGFFEPEKIDMNSYRNFLLDCWGPQPLPDALLGQLFDELKKMKHVKMVYNLSPNRKVALAPIPVNNYGGIEYDKPSVKALKKLVIDYDKSIYGLTTQGFGDASKINLVLPKEIIDAGTIDLLNYDNDDSLAWPSPEDNKLLKEAIANAFRRLQNLLN